jgi:hypothetical protein
VLFEEPVSANCSSFSFLHFDFDLFSRRCFLKRYTLWERYWLSLQVIGDANTSCDQLPLIESTSLYAWMSLWLCKKRLNISLHGHSITLNTSKFPNSLRRYSACFQIFIRRSNLMGYVLQLPMGQFYRNINYYFIRRWLNTIWWLLYDIPWNGQYNTKVILVLKSLNHHGVSISLMYFFTSLLRSCE